MSERKAFRCAPDSYHRFKTVILDEVRATICLKGLSASDIKKRYPTWRREMHTRLLREEDHYFSVTVGLLLADAVGSRFDVVPRRPAPSRTMAVAA